MWVAVGFVDRIEINGEDKRSARKLGVPAGLGLSDAAQRKSCHTDPEIARTRRPIFWAIEISRLPGHRCQVVFLA